MSGSSLVVGDLFAPFAKWGDQTRFCVSGAACCVFFRVLSVPFSNPQKGISQANFYGPGGDFGFTAPQDNEITKNPFLMDFLFFHV